MDDVFPFVFDTLVELKAENARLREELAALRGGLRALVADLKAEAALAHVRESEQTQRVLRKL